MAGMLPGLVAMVQKKCSICPDVPAPVNAVQVINSKKVSDHHAIIPTKTLEGADLSELPGGEKAVLELVALRLVCAVGEPYRYLESVMELDCAGHTFKAKGKSVISPGWKAYAGKQDEKEEPAAELPVLEERAELPLASVELKEGKTSPPKHFTEDLLLSAMEAAGAEEMPKEAERRASALPPLAPLSLKSWCRRVSWSAGAIRKRKSLSHKQGRGAGHGGAGADSIPVHDR